MYNWSLKIQLKHQWQTSRLWKSDTPLFANSWLERQKRCLIVNQWRDILFSESAESFQFGPMAATNADLWVFMGDFFALIVFLQLREITWPCNEKHSSKQSWLGGESLSMGLLCEWTETVRPFTNKDIWLINTNSLVFQESGIFLPA